MATLAHLQRSGADGGLFYVFNAKGTRYLCRWVKVRKGLFEIIQCEGKPAKKLVRCDVQGAPHARAERLN